MDAASCSCHWPARPGAAWLPVLQEGPAPPEAEQQQELFKLYQDTMESAFRQLLAGAHSASGRACSDGPVVSLQDLAQQLLAQDDKGGAGCDEEVRLTPARHTHTR